MGKVRLEIRPWLSDALGSEKPGLLVLEEEIQAGATIGDLLRKLIAEHQAFDKVLFDPESRQLRNYICIVINGQLSQPQTGLDASLKDSDTITLLPFIDGG